MLTPAPSAVTLRPPPRARRRASLAAATACGLGLGIGLAAFQLTGGGPAGATGGSAGATACGTSPSATASVSSPPAPVIGIGGSAAPTVIPVPASGTPLVIQNGSGMDVVVERTAVPSFSIPVSASATATIPFPGDASPSDYAVDVRPVDPSATPLPAGFTLTVPTPSPTPSATPCATASPTVTAADSTSTAVSTVVQAAAVASTPAVEATSAAVSAAASPTSAAATPAPQHVTASKRKATGVLASVPAVAEPSSLPPVGIAAQGVSPELSSDQGGAYVMPTGMNPDEAGAAAPASSVPVPAVASVAPTSGQTVAGGYSGGDLGHLTPGSLPDDGRALAASTGSSLTKAQRRAFGLPAMLGLVLVAGVASAVGQVRRWHRRFG